MGFGEKLLKGLNTAAGKTQEVEKSIDKNLGTFNEINKKIVQDKVQVDNGKAEAAKFANSLFKEQGVEARPEAIKKFSDDFYDQTLSHIDYNKYASSYASNSEFLQTEYDKALIGMADEYGYKSDVIETKRFNLIDSKIQEFELKESRTAEEGPGTLYTLVDELTVLPQNIAKLGQSLWTGTNYISEQSEDISFGFGDKDYGGGRWGAVSNLFGSQGAIVDTVFAVAGLFTAGGATAVGQLGKGVLKTAAKQGDEMAALLLKHEDLLENIGKGGVYQKEALALITKESPELGKFLSKEISSKKTQSYVSEITANMFGTSIASPGLMVAGAGINALPIMASQSAIGDYINPVFQLGTLGAKETGNYLTLSEDGVNKTYKERFYEKAAQEDYPNVQFDSLSPTQKRRFQERMEYRYKYATPYEIYSDGNNKGSWQKAAFTSIEAIANAAGFLGAAKAGGVAIGAGHSKLQDNEGYKGYVKQVDELKASIQSKEVAGEDVTALRERLTSVVSNSKYMNQSGRVNERMNDIYSEFLSNVSRVGDVDPVLAKEYQDKANTIDTQLQQGVSKEVESSLMKQKMDLVSQFYSTKEGIITKSKSLIDSHSQELKDIVRAFQSKNAENNVLGQFNRNLKWSKSAGSTNEISATMGGKSLADGLFGRNPEVLDMFYKEDGEPSLIEQKASVITEGVKSVASFYKTKASALSNLSGIEIASTSYSNQVNAVLEARISESFIEINGGKDLDNNQKGIVKSLVDSSSKDMQRLVLESAIAMGRTNADVGTLMNGLFSDKFGVSIERLNQKEFSQKNVDNFFENLMKNGNAFNDSIIDSIETTKEILGKEFNELANDIEIERNKSTKAFREMEAAESTLAIQRTMNAVRDNASEKQKVIEATADLNKTTVDNFMVESQGLSQQMSGALTDFVIKGNQIANDSKMAEALSFFHPSHSLLEVPPREVVLREDQVGLESIVPSKKDIRLQKFFADMAETVDNDTQPVLKVISGLKQRQEIPIDQDVSIEIASKNTQESAMLSNKYSARIAQNESDITALNTYMDVYAKWSDKIDRQISEEEVTGKAPKYIKLHDVAKAEGIKINEFKRIEKELFDKSTSPEQLRKSKKSLVTYNKKNKESFLAEKQSHVEMLSFLKKEWKDNRVNTDLILEISNESVPHESKTSLLEGYIRHYYHMDGRSVKEIMGNKVDAYFWNSLNGRTEKKHEGFIMDVDPDGKITYTLSEEAATHTSKGGKKTNLGRVTELERGMAEKGIDPSIITTVRENGVDITVGTRLRAIGSEEPWGADYEVPSDYGETGSAFDRLMVSTLKAPSGKNITGDISNQTSALSFMYDAMDAVMIGDSSKGTRKSINVNGLSESALHTGSSLQQASIDDPAKISSMKPIKYFIENDLAQMQDALRKEGKVLLFSANEAGTKMYVHNTGKKDISPEQYKTIQESKLNSLFGKSLENTKALAKRMSKLNNDELYVKTNDFSSEFIGNKKGLDGKPRTPGKIQSLVADKAEYDIIKSLFKGGKTDRNLTASENDGSYISMPNFHDYINSAFNLKEPEIKAGFASKDGDFVIKGLMERLSPEMYSVEPTKYNKFLAAYGNKSMDELASTYGVSYFMHKVMKDNELLDAKGDIDPQKLDAIDIIINADTYKTIGGDSPEVGSVIELDIEGFRVKKTPDVEDSSTYNYSQVASSVKRKHNINGTFVNTSKEANDLQDKILEKQELNLQKAKDAWRDALANPDRGVEILESALGKGLSEGTVYGKAGVLKMLGVDGVSTTNQAMNSMMNKYLRSQVLNLSEPGNRSYMKGGYNIREIESHIEGNQDLIDKGYNKYNYIVLNKDQYKDKVVYKDGIPRMIASRYPSTKITSMTAPRVLWMEDVGMKEYKGNSIVMNPYDVFINKEGDFDGDHGNMFFRDSVFASKESLDYFDKIESQVLKNYDPERFVSLLPNLKLEGDNPSLLLRKEAQASINDPKALEVMDEAYDSFSKMTRLFSKFAQEGSPDINVLRRNIQTAKEGHNDISIRKKEGDLVFGDDTYLQRMVEMFDLDWLDDGQKQMNSYNKDSYYKLVESETPDYMFKDFNSADVQSVETKLNGVSFYDLEDAKVDDDVIVRPAPIRNHPKALGVFKRDANGTEVKIGNIPERDEILDPRSPINTLGEQEHNAKISYVGYREGKKNSIRIEIGNSKGPISNADLEKIPGNKINKEAYKFYLSQVRKKTSIKNKKNADLKVLANQRSILGLNNYTGDIPTVLKGFVDRVAEEQGIRKALKSRPSVGFLSKAVSVKPGLPNYVSEVSSTYYSDFSKLSDAELLDAWKELKKKKSSWNMSKNIRSKLDFKEKEIDNKTINSYKELSEGTVSKLKPILKRLKSGSNENYQHMNKFLLSNPWSHFSDDFGGNLLFDIIDPKETQNLFSKMNKAKVDLFIEKAYPGVGKEYIMDIAKSTKGDMNLFKEKVSELATIKTSDVLLNVEEKNQGIVKSFLPKKDYITRNEFEGVMENVTLTQIALSKPETTILMKSLINGSYRSELAQGVKNWNNEHTEGFLELIASRDTELVTALIEENKAKESKANKAIESKRKQSISRLEKISEEDVKQEVFNAAQDASYKDEPSEVFKDNVQEVFTNHQGKVAKKFLENSKLFLNDPISVEKFKNSKQATIFKKIIKSPYDDVEKALADTSGVFKKSILLFGAISKPLVEQAQGYMMRLEEHNNIKRFKNEETRDAAIKNIFNGEIDTVNLIEPEISDIKIMPEMGDLVTNAVGKENSEKALADIITSVSHNISMRNVITAPGVAYSKAIGKANELLGDAVQAGFMVGGKISEGFYKTATFGKLKGNFEELVQGHVRDVYIRNITDRAREAVESGDPARIQEMKYFFSDPKTISKEQRQSNYELSLKIKDESKREGLKTFYVYGENPMAVKSLDSVAPFMNFAWSTLRNFNKYRSTLGAITAFAGTFNEEYGSEDYYYDPESGDFIDKNQKNLALGMFHMFEGTMMEDMTLSPSRYLNDVQGLKANSHPLYQAMSGNALSIPTANLESGKISPTEYWTSLWFGSFPSTMVKELGSVTGSGEGAAVKDSRGLVTYMLTGQAWKDQSLKNNLTDYYVNKDYNKILESTKSEKKEFYASINKRRDEKGLDHYNDEVLSVYQAIEDEGLNGEQNALEKGMLMVLEDMNMDPDNPERMPFAEAIASSEKKLRDMIMGKEIYKQDFDIKDLESFLNKSEKISNHENFAEFKKVNPGYAENFEFFGKNKKSFEYYWGIKNDITLPSTGNSLQGEDWFKGTVIREMLKYELDGVPTSSSLDKKVDMFMTGDLNIKVDGDGNPVFTKFFEEYSEHKGLLAQDYISRSAKLDSAMKERSLWWSMYHEQGGYEAEKNGSSLLKGIKERAVQSEAVALDEYTRLSQEHSNLLDLYFIKNEKSEDKLEGLKSKAQKNFTSYTKKQYNTSKQKVTTLQKVNRAEFKSVYGEPLDPYIDAEKLKSKYFNN